MQAIDKLLAKVLSAGTTKPERLKVAIIKESVGLGAGLLGLVLLTLGVGAWADGASRQRNELNNKVSSLITETNALETKLTKAERSLPMYRELIKQNPNGEIILDRQLLGEMLDVFKQQYVLPSMKVTLSTLKDRDETKYKNGSMQAQQCEIGLALEAPSDEYLFRMLRHLRTSIPGGMIKVTSMNVAKSIPPDAASLSALRQTGKPGYTKAEVKAMWYGMKSIKKPDSPKKGP